MKKGILCLIVCLLFGCTQPLKIEKEAVLNVAVASEEYAGAFNELWNKTYPEHENSLNLHVLAEGEIEKIIFEQQPIPYDIFFIEDRMVGLIMNDLYELPANFERQFETTINPEFSNTLAKVKPVYYATEADGFLYAVDLNLMAEKQLSLEDFASFEQLAKIENSFYYLQQPILTIPLLSSDSRYFPGKEHSTLELKGTPFKNSLENYLLIMELLKLQDDPASFDNWFINQTYMSGLIASWMQADLNEELNQAKYQYLPLPTINNQQLHTLATSYGYVIHHDTLYPQAALSCLKLMHSVEGMQIMSDTTKYVPLILENQLDEFTFHQKHQKEKIIAMNHALQKNLVGIEGHEQVGAMDFLEDAETIQIINACDYKKVDQCVVNLTDAYQEWINHLE